MVESKEYENIRFDFLERWCVEIEKNFDNGTIQKEIMNNEAGTSRELVVKSKHDLKQGKQIKNYLVFSSSDESDVEVTHAKRKKLTSGEPIKIENDEKKKGAKIKTYLVFSSSDEE